MRGFIPWNRFYKPSATDCGEHEPHFRAVLKIEEIALLPMMRPAGAIQNQQAMSDVLAGNNDSPTRGQKGKGELASAIGLPSLALPR
jgi:hypothetical protein